MNKRFIILTHFILTILFCSSFISFADVAPAGLTLEEALRIAYRQHPKMIEARQEISGSKGRWIQAEALPDPELEMDIGGFKKHATEENGKQVRDAKLDSFAIRQPLDPLGTRFLKGRMAHDEVNIAKGERLLIWGEIRKKIIELYARILAEEKAVEIGKDNLNVTRQFFTNVQTRFQTSNALRSDMIRAKIEVSRAENDMLISQKNWKVSMGEMNLSLGRPVDTPLSLSDSLSYEKLHYEYEKIRKEALVQRADIHNEMTRLSMRKKGLWSALLKTFFPKMAIGIQRTTQDFDNDTAILLSASYPLWGLNWGQIKEAKAEKQKQAVHLDALKQQVSLEVYQAFLEAELADKQVVLQKQALEEANELLRQVNLQYQQGEIPFLNYLENIKAIKETRLAYFNALKNHKEKIAELEKVIQATPIPIGAKP